MSRLAASSCMLGWLLVACTGDAYLGAIVSDAGRSVGGPHAGQPASGSGGDGGGDSPPTASDAGRDSAAAAGTSGEPPPGSFDAGSRETDASVPEDDDAGSTHGAGETPCVTQPSFEISPAAGAIIGVAYTQMPWTACFTLQDATYSAPLWVNETTIVNVGGVGMSQVLRPASEGSTYLYLDVNLGGQGQSTSAMLCNPVRAGVTYAFAVDLMTRDSDNNGMSLPPGKLELYTSPNSCSLDDGALWTSPALTPNWQTYCARFTPVRDSSYLILRLPMSAGGKSAIGVDHIRVERGCGAPQP